MGKIGNSWRLMMSSFAVIGENKKLLIFPALTGFLTLGIFLFFFGSVAFQPTGHKYSDPAHWKAVGSSLVTVERAPAAAKADAAQPPAAPAKAEGKLTTKGEVTLAALYFLSMFFATFFSTAFCHEILGALRGQPVSISGGLSFAVSKIPAILMWSLLAGLVGFLIQKLEQNLGFVGRIIVRLVGVSWSIAAVFAIPVLIETDTLNPVRMLQASAQSLRKTWGETLTGYVGLQGAGILVVLTSTLFLAGGLALGAHLNAPVLAVGSVVLWLLGLFAFSYVMGVAGSVYRCALYCFASTGEIPSAYDRESMDMAWKMKAN